MPCRFIEQSIRPRGAWFPPLTVLILCLPHLTGSWVSSPLQARQEREERDSPGRQSTEQLERLEITVGDLVFEAIAAGPVDGELVLLLHGFPQTGHAFRHQLVALAAQGFRAVAPDQRGYSPGARPESVAAYGTTHLVSDVMGMADALGHDRFHLVGHDWGGAVSWAAATRYPDRILSLTVLSTPHFAALGALRSNPESDQARRSSYFSDFAAPEAEQRFLANDQEYLRQILGGLDVPETDLQVYLDRLGTPEAMRSALNWYRALVTPPSDGRGARPSRPPPISVPTLYIWGTEDGAFSREAAERSGEFVSAPYLFLPLSGHGHWLPENAAETVSRLLIDHVSGHTAKADDRSASLRDPLDSYRRARAVVDRAALALGGIAVDEFKTLHAEYSAVELARGQSRRPGPPYDTVRVTGSFAYETGEGFLHEAHFQNAGGTDRSFRRVVRRDSSWNYWIARDLLSPITSGDAAFIHSKPYLYLPKALPHELVRSALGAPGTLRLSGRVALDHGIGVRVSFSEGPGQIVSLVMDSITGLPVLAERLGSDLLLGDVVESVEFGHYQRVDGLLVPHELLFSLMGEPLKKWNLGDVRVNVPLTPAELAPPETAWAENPPAFKPREIVPGVHMVRLFSGSANSYNTVLVEFDSFVAVLEAPLVDLFYGPIARIAGAVAPGKPIRYLVTTHAHHDHLGGARAFLSRGSEILTTAQAAELIEQMATAPHTLAPNALGGTGTVTVVTDRHVLTEGDRRLVLMQVGPTPHVEEILLAYLPTERLLFVADLFAIPENRVFPPASPTFRQFAELIARLGLDVQHIVPAHGIPGTREDLDRAIRQ